MEKYKHEKSIFSYRASVFYEKSINFASKMICIYDKKQNIIPACCNPYIFV